MIVYESRCVLQIGFAAESSNGNGEAVGVNATKLMQGTLYQGVIKSGARKFVSIDHPPCISNIVDYLTAT